MTAVQQRVVALCRELIERHILPHELSDADWEMIAHASGDLRASRNDAETVAARVLWCCENKRGFFGETPPEV